MNFCWRLDDNGQAVSVHTRKIAGFTEMKGIGTVTHTTILRGKRNVGTSD